MTERPAIGSRIRIRDEAAVGSHWWPSPPSSRVGTVKAYHIDGIAFVVRLDPLPGKPPERVLLSPLDVELVEAAS